MIRKIARLNTSLGLTPTFALDNGRLRAQLSDVVVCQPNKLNIPDEKQRASGVSHTDVNEGQSGHNVPYANAASCVGPTNLSGKMAQMGVNIETISSVAQCVEIGNHMADTVGGTGVSQFTSQMNEAYGNFFANKHYLTNDDSKSWQIEKAIADRQRARGGKYYSGYDGVIRYDAIMRPSDAELASDAALLGWLGQGLITGFGQRAFIPHQLLDGTFVSGAAEYRDIIVATYFQGATDPAEFVANTGFRMMAAKRGLVALAAQVQNAAIRADVLGRKPMNFTWNKSAQIGQNEHILQRTRPAGYSGQNQHAYFQPASPQVMFASMLVGLLESPVAYDWEDTTRYGNNPQFMTGFDSNGYPAGTLQAVVGKAGVANGSPIGYVGSESPQYAINCYKYVPGQQCPYPILPLGNMDITYQVLDALARLRGNVDNAPFGYASLKGLGEANFCDKSQIRRYHRDRFVAKQPWGYEAVNTSTNRASLQVNMFHRKPWERQTVDAQIDGRSYALRDTILVNGQPTLVGLAGGRSHEFVIDLETGNTQQI